LEMDRLRAKCEHLRSQNDLLQLSLDDAKTSAARLAVAAGKLEANASALKAAEAEADRMTEAYDVLVALLETELAQREAAGVVARRAIANRRSAESVARHLLAKSTGGSPGSRADSGVGSGRGGHLNTSWDADSSGYSHTTASSTSTASAASSVSQADDTTAALEARLREHISGVKALRAAVLSSLVDVGPLHAEDHVVGVDGRGERVQSSSGRLESAAMAEEAAASREERAELRAKVYVLEREAESAALRLKDRAEVESALRLRLEHLQEEVAAIGPVRGPAGEQRLRERVEALSSSVERVTRGSEARQASSDALIGDLKRANR